MKYVTRTEAVAAFLTGAVIGLLVTFVVIAYL